MKLALVVVAAAAVLALTGCSGISADRASLNSTGVPAPIHTRTGLHAGNEGTGAAGSLTVALTKPISVAGHVDTTVSCSTGRTYRAAAGPVTIDGTSVSLSVSVAAFTGPGSYSAVVTASVTPSGSDATQVAGLPGIPVTITSAGGAVNLSATGTAGRVVAGSFTWACS